MSSNNYKLSPKVMAILEPLVEFELYQSSKYIQVANVANRLGFFLAESYYISESKDERKHAMIHYDYITGRGSEFQMPSIEEPSVEAKDLYELTEIVLQMESEASDMYQTACVNVFGLCQMTYNHLLQFLTIQQEALKFNIDACSALEGLDKTGQQVVEGKIFKG
jgi:ferritin